MWWIGDWLVFGVRKYPDAYAAAARKTGLAYQTLRVARMVADRYSGLLIRINKLSWSHHRIAASIEDDALLTRVQYLAVKEGWNRGRLRAVVKALRGGVTLEDATAAAVDEADEDDADLFLDGPADPEARDRVKTYNLINGVLHPARAAAPTSAPASAISRGGAPSRA